MVSWFSQASGIIIISACGSDRPVDTSSSSALSNPAVSLAPSRMIGLSLAMSSPKSGDENSASRARIQFWLPRIVLISPLWHSIRYGCASRQEPRVLVL